jgi:hypothetical protein
MICTKIGPDLHNHYENRFLFSCRGLSTRAKIEKLASSVRTEDGHDDDDDGPPAAAAAAVALRAHAQSTEHRAQSTGDSALTHELPLPLPLRC